MRTKLQELEQLTLQGDAEATAKVVKALRRYRAALAEHDRRFHDMGRTRTLIDKIENLNLEE